VRWAQDHAVAEVLALPAFDQDDLYHALDDLCARQEKIETTLYARYVRQHTQSPSEAEPALETTCPRWRLFWQLALISLVDG
jgi:hypothetical protein